ncbi:MAG: hypothetical protein IKJ41_00790 [Clostridia bacterium]|nr:hypothetical protein [Clostridia bacterium]
MKLFDFCGIKNDSATHNPEVAGSSPVSATKKHKSSSDVLCFFFFRAGLEGRAIQNNISAISPKYHPLLCAISANSFLDINLKISIIV